MIITIVKGVERHSPASNAERLAAEILDAFVASGTYQRENLSELAKLAIYGDEGGMEAATRAIFVLLAERLADSFDPGAVTLYNRAFSQLVQICRSRQRELDKELTSFGLLSEDHLVARAEQLRHVVSFKRLTASAGLGDKVKRLIVLSRVTFGADVAITSVIVERLKQLFPATEIVFIGGRKLTELFGGDHRLRFVEVGYRRGGTLMDRLLSWIDLLNCVGAVSNGLERAEYLVIDPDTRLTQLGLLPVSGLKERGSSFAEYLFFPSREYGSSRDASLSQLTNDWLDEVFGDGATTPPKLCLARADHDMGGELVARLRRAGARMVVSINLGTGENPAKRVGDDFEKSVVNALIHNGGTIILDRGIGAEENGLVDALLTRLAGLSRVRTIEVDEDRLPGVLRSEGLAAQVVIWRGRIGLMAAMIGASDLYLGYDSACQHIAAALGVPCIDIFAGYSSPRMRERWRPTGPAEVSLIDAGGAKSAAELVAEVMAHVERLRKAGE